MSIQEMLFSEIGSEANVLVSAFYDMNKTNLICIACVCHGVCEV